MKNKKYLFYISQNYSFSILRPIQKEAIERNEEVAWFVEGESVNKEYFKHDEVLLKSVSEIYDYNPDAVLYPANIAPTFLPGINVAIFHGFDAGKLDRSGKNDHYKDRRCFDLYCTQGPESTREFLALQSTPKQFNVIETGWSALDGLFTPEYKSVKRKKDAKPTILYCSTFSKKLSSAPYLLPVIEELSKTGKWQWLIQFHPKMCPEIVKQYKGIQNQFLTFVETDDVVSLLNEADVMLCDTSSVILMFLLQHRPVVTFNNIEPKNYLIDINKPEHLDDAITHALLKPQKLMDNIQKLIDEIHPYSDGKSASRVLDAITETINDKPNLVAHKKDFIRQIKMRKKLKHWKF